MSGRRILGVLGGEHMTPARVSAWLESSDYVIAADGGLLRVLEAGFVPDVIIGDFDSAPHDLIDASTTKIVDVDQDHTDCCKLLNYLAAQGETHVTLICAEGDLTDHFLDTIHNAVRSDMTVSIGLERGQAHILKGQVSESFEASVGARTSLLPIETMVNVEFSGVNWPLRDATLSVRGQTSISNKVTSSPVRVGFDEGVGYLFIEGDTPVWPMNFE